MGDPRGGAWQPHKAEGTYMNNSSQDPVLEMEKTDTERIPGIQGGLCEGSVSRSAHTWALETPQDRGRAT